MLRKRTAAILYGVTGIVSLVLGAIYLFRTSFMPYHEAALGRPWDAIDADLQVLISALMDVAGAGWIALGVATIVLAVANLRSPGRWIGFLLPAVLLVFYVPTLLATLDVLRATPATPPWYGNAAACAATVLGIALDRPWRRRAEGAA